MFGVAVGATATGLMDNENTINGNSALQKAKDNLIQARNNLLTGADKSQANLNAHIDAITDGDLTNVAQNQDILNKLNTQLTQDTTAKDTQVFLTQSTTNPQGEFVQGLANPSKGHTYLDIDHLDNAIETLNHEIAHHNGQGETSATRMGKLGNIAYNIGTSLNKEDIDNHRQGITPTTQILQNLSTDEQLAYHTQNQALLDENKGQLEGEMESGDGFESYLYHESGLRNPKLTDRQRRHIQALKDAGATSYEALERKYDACKDDVCREVVRKEWQRESDRTRKIELNLAKKVVLTPEDFDTALAIVNGGGFIGVNTPHLDAIKDKKHDLAVRELSSWTQPDSVARDEAYKQEDIKQGKSTKQGSFEDLFMTAGAGTISAVANGRGRVTVGSNASVSTHKTVQETFSENVMHHNTQIGVRNSKMGTISGSHQQDAFLESIEKTKSRIVGAKMTDTRFPGLVEYKYQIPALHPRTNQPTGEYKTVQTKTTYDNRVLSDQKVAEMSSIAASQANVIFQSNPQIRKTTVKINGYYFEVTKDSKTNRANNAYFVIPPRN
ncbi:CdiA family toxin C-terminal domain-containing protein [Moraxella bovis]|uniref:Uncharacterized protein n=1 Tax=Moraxella bovis TaxID=476 RepID=A0A378PQ37_MORBO|nr:CdiA family toxin C-terminal domain-containing protein [Moraxella bovis]STY88598.1 Uncharacterised protein [Moraxella bovis]